MTTKLILAILRGDSEERVRPRLLDAGLRVTELSSTGGFLRKGSTTVLIGVEEDQIEAALNIFRETIPTPEGEADHNATIFVLNADQFTHF
ncbi:cyclic-di-AMP receptor [Aggregatilinea lenta]|uniref:cyclic-di-AMP receptor n=1 Tax=Aggregatilinea lenta TaxID=913108 RepID=UPI000E5C3113|nr:cyclic-di-AMP receptor [Aggregatilinea lenta]